MESPVSVESTISDLTQRWDRARTSAFRLVDLNGSNKECFQKIASLTEEKFEELCRAVFLNSRQLGKSYQRNYQLTWEREDFVHFARHLGSPCLVGEWSEKKNASVLTRKACSGGQECGPRFCQFWREAVDGIVLGLSDEVGFVRNQSFAVGDRECIDVFFEEEASPTDMIWKNENKWGSLPATIRPGLEEIEKKFDSMKIDLQFLGLTEKQLIYKLEPRENLTCGTAGTLYRTHLEKIVSERFPMYQLKDASPVAVYGEKA